jgi:hypothetical protein
MQATALDPVLDAPRAEAKRQEIGARDDPMLRTD